MWCVAGDDSVGGIAPHLVVGGVKTGVAQMFGGFLHGSGFHYPASGIGGVAGRNPGESDVLSFFTCGMI